VTPPALEIADLIRTAGAAFVERNRQWIGWKHVKVLLAIARCRTAALGGHFDECTRCAHRAPISYNSCRDRHCPKCQIAARERWIAARERELLPTRYLHVVFTLPRHLAPVVLQNKNKFLRRFLLHLLPQGFVRIRHFGFLACRRRSTTLPLCFQLLGAAQEALSEEHTSSTEDTRDLYRCPKCGGPMKVIERLTAAQIQLRSPPRINSAA